MSRMLWQPLSERGANRNTVGTPFSCSTCLFHVVAACGAEPLHCLLLFWGLFAWFQGLCLVSGFVISTPPSLDRRDAGATHSCTFLPHRAISYMSHHVRGVQQWCPGVRYTVQHSTHDTVFRACHGGRLVVPCFDSPCIINGGLVAPTAAWVYLDLEITSNPSVPVVLAVHSTAICALRPDYGCCRDTTTTTTTVCSVLGT